MDDAERRAWAYLSAVAEPPCGPLVALVEHLGALEAARAVADRRVPAGFEKVLAATAARFEKNTAAADLDVVDRLGGRLVTPHDPEWPGWPLLGLTRTPEAATSGPPLALWVRGRRRLDHLVEGAVAMVGSRACTAYGRHCTGLLVDDLIGGGRPIVSGGAYGIDAAAHRSALGGGGTTVAVLACGIDVDYPAPHGQLFAEIAATGGLVTEYAPGTSGMKHRFLTRNRLVAALSSAVVVVEAGRRSGTANTAKWARWLGLPLGAVPGPISSAMSVGCHKLISEEQAQVIVDGAGIERMICPDGLSIGAVPVGDRGHGTDGVSPAIDLDDTAARVRDALPRSGSATVAEIAFAVGVDVPSTRSALAVLDIHGLAEAIDGGWRSPVVQGAR
ncbi:DNA-processing protein DprA [Williamsia sp. CHRR-6]|uniref:DNA-processing protein DprA n=1 Tax=Williamsia sp. CHRR-6 TaxID=2835871 RepID=UPI001BD9D2A8|nr:DNA-processing protein DprA [Williamsia sp. CHRR-6]MBT0568372.1 DNA-processing protein DprA [Williamsia sp. CHRR-6]